MITYNRTFPNFFFLVFCWRKVDLNKSPLSSVGSESWSLDQKSSIPVYPSVGRLYSHPTTTNHSDLRLVGTSCSDVTMYRRVVCVVSRWEIEETQLSENKCVTIKTVEKLFSNSINFLVGKTSYVSNLLFKKKKNLVMRRWS